MSVSIANDVHIVVGRETDNKQIDKDIPGECVYYKGMKCVVILSQRCSVKDALRLVAF